LAPFSRGFRIFPTIDMAAAAASSAFFSGTSSSAAASARVSPVPGGVPGSLDARGIKSKSMSSSGAMQVKANAQVAPKINGTKVGLKTDAPMIDEDVASSAPRTFYNQLPDWSVLLAAMTTILLAAEKQLTFLDWKPKRPDMLADAFNLGRIVHDGLAFRQNFSIRSYEIGADRTASIETLMNHLQETALNHVRSAGLLGDGFGATPEMSKRNLIWVVTKMQVHVEHYPAWGDVVEVDTWVGASGKNGMRRDWRVRDSHTGQTITRATRLVLFLLKPSMSVSISATNGRLLLSISDVGNALAFLVLKVAFCTLFDVSCSVWVMMNKHTRKLSKLPEEVRAEIEPYFIERSAVVDEDSRKLLKIDDDTADYVCKGLVPRWGDLDVNQHVNNVKYIGWILESAPVSILENHQLASMTLEYRRECGKDSVLQSLTAVNDNCAASGGAPEIGVECDHLLRLEDGAEIVRGRTEWRLKPTLSSGSVGHAPSSE
ncbi:hypothetical protein Taro_022079, partial [Colocasia esculenta]|nr:hypothetical protein [Colocasia esculenta]